MDILRSFRRIDIEKNIRRMNIIQAFLKEDITREWIKQIICESISKLNRRYFGDDDLVDVLSLDTVSSRSYLERLRDEAFVVKLFNKHGLLNHIVMFNDFKIKKSLKERIKLFFNDYPLVDDMLRDLRIIRDGFFKSKKEAEKLYSTALNKIEKDEKIYFLRKALKISQWGSLISVRVVHAIILISSGEKLGKTYKKIEY